MKFEERAEEMGLTDNGDRTFSYQDIHGCVNYKYLSTPHETIPYLALFAGADSNNLMFETILSDLYYFEGNENINSTIRDSISSSDNGIFRENTIIGKNYCFMYNQIVINNSTEINDGNIYPSLIILNSYNGTKKKEICFGITVEGEDTNIYGTLRNQLGSLSQVHSERHSTIMSSVFNEYVDIISSNITDVIDMNMQNELDEHSILASLDYLEHFGGKRRRENISSFLQEISGEERNITSWDLFLSILRYSVYEKNINMKLAMESIAERSIVLPARMIEACKQINN